MRKFLLALVLAMLPTLAFGQCNGVFPNNTVCGNSSGAAALPYPAPMPGTVGTIRIVTSGAITISATDYAVVCNKAVAVATAVSLPAVSTRNGQFLYLYDWQGTCGDLTFTPNGAETIGDKATWIVGSGGVPGSGGWIVLIPSTGLSGWIPGP